MSHQLSAELHNETHEKECVAADNPTNTLISAHQAHEAGSNVPSRVLFMKILSGQSPFSKVWQF